MTLEGWDPQFWTTLIKVTRKPDTERAERSLRDNCTHVTGPYWIMEGCADCLRDDGLKFREIKEGIVGCLGDLTEAELVQICQESFGVTL